MKKVIVIVGPTGVGKTKLSIELSKRYHGEVVNGDSMQVYTGLDIGTAKVKKEEMEGVAHHLFDIRDVREEYSLYDYQKDCRHVIEEIWERRNVPIIVGGTGFYIKGAMYDYRLDNFKEKFEDYSDISTDELYNQLIKMDKDIDKNSVYHNRRRIIHAIRYYKKNGSSISLNKTDKILYDAVFIGLTTDRECLYEMINNRVIDMINEGLLEEVRAIYEKGIYTKPLAGGIGYKELYEYFDGKVSLEEAISNIQRNSRRYAKRQYTYFKNQLPVKWFDTNYENFEKTVLSVCHYLDNHFFL